MSLIKLSRSHTLRFIVETPLQFIVWRFKKIRNEIRKITRHIHKNEQIEVAKTAKTNPKKFGAYVKNKTSSSTIGDIKDKDTIISEDDKKAFAFCRYFSSAFTIDDNFYLELNLADPDPSSSVIEFDESDLNKALEHINVYKSPGPNGIHPRILYETRNTITAPLKKIFETSLLLKRITLQLANSKYFSHT